jgi:hypothetical protein
MLLLHDDFETIHVASQASVNTEGDTEMRTIKSMTKEMFSEFKTSRKEMQETILE